MKKLSFCMIALVAAIGLQSCGDSNEKKTDDVEVAKDINDKSAKTVDEKVSNFMVKAASGGMMEVELGTMATEKAANPRVKEFGAMMVADHTAANMEMKTVADQKGVTLPVGLSEEHQKHVNDMKEKSGKDFDKAYMSMMVDDHKKDISEFEDAAKFDDADVKAFATKTIPVLQKHLDSAKSVHDAVK